MLRSHVIGAVFKRNVASYFSGVLGYLFIVVFVIAGAMFAFRAEFFSHNLANLDQLSAYFPRLLLFLVPAITMAAWAEERRVGTDELLFTLPATDLEIIIGKYLAVLAVYTIALVFSMTHSLVLAWLGSTNAWYQLSWLFSPDWGLLLTTYFGYWLAGAALLSAGMFASSLTSSTTVAFVLGVVICAIPVSLDEVPGLPGALERLTLQEQFSDFAMGVVPLGGVLYFLSLTAFMLYLNFLMVGRRHWSTIDSHAPPVWLDACIWAAAAIGFVLVCIYAPGGTLYAVSLCVIAAITLYTVFALLLGPDPGRHYAGRVAALAAILISWNYLAAQVDSPLDMTEENLFTISETTDEVLDAIPDNRTVMIDAYVSPEVPDEYQEVRRQLLGLLRQIDRRGGNRVQVNVVDVEPYSEEAESASSTWGIEARPVQWEREGRFLMADIYLGAVVRGMNEVVIPFFDLGNSVEYELTRAIGTVSQEKRMTVGILTTDAKVMGGFDMQTFQSQPRWQIAEELEKQYDVVEVSPDSPISAEDYDVLIAVLPSSLTEPQMANFVDYVEGGGATLIFDDPVPRVMVQNAPLREKPPQGGGMGFQGGSEPKADEGRLTALLDTLECAWERYHLHRNPDEPAGVDFILLDTFNPHPEFSDVLGPEWVFVTAESGVETALNPNSPATSELQEIMTMFPGSIRPRSGSELQFKPLLRSSTNLSGLTDWDEVQVNMGFLGTQIVSNPRYRVDDTSHVIAAHVRSHPDADSKRNVIFVADTDMITDFMFRIQEQQLYDLRINNTTFVLNAVDTLAADVPIPGTAEGGSADTITLQSGSSGADDYYNGTWIRITNDEPEGADEQMRRVVDYDGSTRVATVDSEWDRAPIAGRGKAQGGSTNSITLADDASDEDDFYNGAEIRITNDVPEGVHDQTHRIVEYDGESRVATINAEWSTVPSEETTYEITPTSYEILPEDGTAAGGSLTTVTLAETASDEHDFYNGRWIRCTSGPPSGVDNEMRLIVDYNGKTKVATVDSAWRAIPSGGESGTAQDGSDDTITLDGEASDEDDYYNGMWIEVTNDRPEGAEGQVRRIVDYDGGTKEATVDVEWDTNPSNRTEYEFVPTTYEILRMDYLALRNRRPSQHRLTRVESRKQKFQEELNQSIDDAESDAEDRLEDAREELQKKIEEIENDPSLDEIQRQRAIAIAQEEQQRLLDIEQEEIEREKEQEIRTLRAQTEREIREIENRVWWAAVFLPALPAFLLGAIVLLIRLLNEQSTISPDRLVRR